MTIYPAIDLKEGTCVRLFQGDMKQAKEYSDNPEEMAKKWEREGATYLHVVDLDGAASGKARNRDAVSRIIKAVNIPVQMGGGLRTIGNIEIALTLGLARVIVGTAAVKDPEIVSRAIDRFGPEKILVGLDATNGQIKTEGWSRGSSVNYIDLAKKMQKVGVKQVVYTDIEKDGAMQGPNLEYTKKLAEETGMTVIASGGISSVEDVDRVKELEPAGVEGMIIGKALYEESISLREIL